MKGRTAMIQRESARRLARLGSSERGLKPISRRRFGPSLSVCRVLPGSCRCTDCPSCVSRAPKSGHLAAPGI